MSHNEPNERHSSEASHGGHGHEPHAELRPGWSIPQPEAVPRPTYWPAVTAAGVALIGLGIITSLILSGMGIVLIILGIGGWIYEFRYGEEE